MGAGKGGFDCKRKRGRRQKVARIDEPTASSENTERTRWPAARRGCRAGPGLRLRPSLPLPPPVTSPLSVAGGAVRGICSSMEKAECNIFTVHSNVIKTPTHTRLLAQLRVRLPAAFARVCRRRCHSASVSTRHVKLLVGVVWFLIWQRTQVEPTGCEGVLPGVGDGNHPSSGTASREQNWSGGKPVSTQDLEMGNHVAPRAEFPAVPRSSAPPASPCRAQLRVCVLAKPPSPARGSPPPSRSQPFWVLQLVRSSQGCPLRAHENQTTFLGACFRVVLW